MMYRESYGLLYSNRQNTVNDREYLLAWIYWSSACVIYNQPAETKRSIQPN